MVCQGLEILPMTEFTDYLIYPTTCFYHFYSIILFGLFLILTFIMYNAERELQIQADLISSAGVSATAVFLLAVIGSLIQTSNGIPLIQRDILMFVIALWIPITALWFFKPSSK